MAQKRKVTQKTEAHVTAVFTQDKVCKHSVRYAWTTPTGQAFTIYVPTQLLPNPAPQKIGVSIEKA